MLHEYIVDPAAVSWRKGQVAGLTFQCQVLLNGADGGPEALHFRFDDCPSVFAHMHLTSQFQLLLHGFMNFPKSTMKLRAIAVHYTDHNFPYGPFAVGEGHDMLVLHPGRGGLINLADRDARRQINLKGRHFYGIVADTDSTTLAGLEGARARLLIPPTAGPHALMIECAPDGRVNLPGAPYGRYEIVLSGSVSGSGINLVASGFRYVRGEGQATSWKAGSDGATLMLLAFDEDAQRGGLVGDRLSIAAAAAMEQAI
jgi:hypothetical protein